MGQKAFFQKLARRTVPLHVQIELTRQCNFACVHCIRSRDMETEMSTAEIKELIRDLAHLGCMQVTFTGGEPLLHPDFQEICRFARSQGIFLRLFTNGSMLNNRKAVQFLKEMRFREVRVTLFALDPVIHDGITGCPGSLNNTLMALTYMQEAQVPFRLAFVVLKRNSAAVGELIEHARKQGWLYHAEYVVYPAYGGGCEPLQERIDDVVLGELSSRGYIACEGYASREAKVEALEQFYLGKLHCYISSVGSVYPHATVRLDLGSIRSKGFSDLWRNSPALNALRSLSCRNFECTQCLSFNRCHWDLGLALAETGSIFKKPAERCRLINLISN